MSDFLWLALIMVGVVAAFGLIVWACDRADEAYLRDRRDE